MIKVEAETKDGRVEATMSFEASTPSQFEDEAEAVIMCTAQFMSEHSELSLREVFMSMISDLDDNGGDAPFNVIREEVVENGETD